MVENSFDHEIQYDKNGNFLSSKRSTNAAKEGGIGLLSIDSIVKNITARSAEKLKRTPIGF